MIRYYERIPSAALRREIDGHLYAYVQHTVTPRGVAECPPRMVRADDAMVKAGEAYVFIGMMGEAVAQRTNIPFPVTALADVQDQRVSGPSFTYDTVIPLSKPDEA